MRILVKIGTNYITSTFKVLRKIKKAIPELEFKINQENKETTAELTIPEDKGMEVIRRLKISSTMSGNEVLITEISTAHGFIQPSQKVI